MADQAAAQYPVETDEHVDPPTESPDPPRKDPAELENEEEALKDPGAVWTGDRAVQVEETQHPA